MPYKPFYNDWLDISALFGNGNKVLNSDTHILPVNLDSDFFDNLRFDQKSFKSYRQQACEESLKLLGDKPALCLSGGVDSQYMVQSFKESLIDFDVVIAVFEKDFNKHDVETAEIFCKENGITLKKIDLNILNFLNRENYDYGIKYASASPHFNTHYKLFNMLRSEGYTGVVCGGNTPIRCPLTKRWGENYKRNTMNFVNYTKVSGMPCIGDFISFYPKLTWSLTIIIEDVPITQSHLDNTHMLHIHQDLIDKRYKNKCKGYIDSGVKIVPQKKKYTGFEYLKEYYSKLNKGDDWAFEKKFRIPLETALMTKMVPGQLKFNMDAETSLDKLMFNMRNTTKRNVVVKSVTKINRNTIKLT